jgi:hypothetical protein
MTLDIDVLNKMLRDGQDNLLLRFALAQALFNRTGSRLPFPTWRKRWNMTLPIPPA